MRQASFNTEGRGQPSLRSDQPMRRGSLLTMGLSSARRQPVSNSYTFGEASAIKDSLTTEGAQIR
jgi:hypothetical protein